VQASVQILTALAANSPAAFSIIANTLNTREVRRPLTELSSRLGLVRRFIRFFRFFDALSDSYTTFTSLTSPAEKDGMRGDSSMLYLERTLEGLASTFNGLYLLLEASTLVDALGIQGLAIWGSELEFAIKIEAQRCWFLALVFGALSCGFKLSKPHERKTVSEKAVGANDSPGKDGKVKIVSEEKTQTSTMTSQQQRLSRKLTACLLDLPLPGSVVGWIPASPGTLGLLMLTTSVLTGYDVWERCGKDIGRG
jgi:hypothetical protein